MDWEIVSTVVQILGTFAVFVSVIYLAIQVRQNSKIARSAARQAIVETIMMPPNNFIQSDSFRHAFIAHLNGDQITPEQSLQLQVYCYMTLKSWENMHFQFRNGMVSDNEWKPMRENLKLLMQLDLWQEYWQRENHIYSSDFNSEIGSLLNEITIEEKDELPDAVAHLKNDQPA